jgi:hypothetical protein
MNSLLELADKNAEAIRTMGARAIADLHAAGIPAYVMREPDAEPDEIVRLDPDGRRFVVRLEDGDFVVIGKLPVRPAGPI